MKYKDINLELPPLGKVIAIIDNNENLFIGYFFIHKNEKAFSTLWRRIAWEYVNNPRKWAYLPIFKDLKDEKPPIGIEVLGSYRDSYGRRYKEITNVEDYEIKNMLIDNFDTIEVDSWIGFEAFKEDN